MSDDIIEESSLDEQIGTAIRKAQNATSKDKLSHLKTVEELLLNRDGASHLIDNFLDEMLEFASSTNPLVKCFLINFIQKACKKDPEVMKKAVTTLHYLLIYESEKNINVTKKAMIAVTNIYPIVLKWAVARKSDSDVEQSWNTMEKIKERIMFQIDSDNDGIKLRVIKYVEAVVLAQTVKGEGSEAARIDQFNLSEIPRDHRYISYRKMAAEGQHCLQNLLDQTTLVHISSNCLLTVLFSLTNIARMRPESLSRVVDAIDALQVNLPPTLGTCQVKAVRKELKLHLFRLIKHPSAVPIATKIATLLSDLGTNQSEIAKVLPAESKKRPQAKDEGPSSKRKKEEMADDDEDEEDEEEDAKIATQAVESTENFIFDNLSPAVAQSLIFMGLTTLPTVMPPSFAATFTPIATAGSETQRRRLARMMATQFTQAGVGPGSEMLRQQKRMAMQQRNIDRGKGAIIPPTPAHALKTETAAPPKKPAIVNTMLPPPVPVKTKAQFSLVSSCKAMSKEERERLFEITIKRIMDNEKRAIQGGSVQAQQKILVRLVSRFKDDNEALEGLLVNFILGEQKARNDLALLWVSEMYAQYQGYSICVSTSKKDLKFSGEERLIRYDHILVLLLRTLFERGEHNQTLFHNLLLQAPLLTPNALSYLKVACIDATYGNFAMQTLRELVLTRSRQRDDLIDLLFHLTFYETAVQKQAVETVKELYEFPYMKSSVRESVEAQLESCNSDVPDIKCIVEGAAREWSPALYRTALALPTSVLAQDHVLIHKMAAVFAKSSSGDFKLTMMRSIESAVKEMGQGSSDILQLLEECPLGAEPLAARIVHLLTEKETATMEIVTRMKAMHESRQTDVRSLLPILSGLAKDDVIALLPKFVLRPQIEKSFPQACKRILSTRNSDTISPVVLIVEYHKIEAKTPDENRLLREHVSSVLKAHRSMTKEAVSSAVEEMLRECDPLPLLLFHTLVVVYDLYPSLFSFLTNVLIKIVTRQLWKSTPEHVKEFHSATFAMPEIAYQVVLTNLEADDVRALIESSDEKVDCKAKLKEALHTLSSHQQRSVSDDILAVLEVKERPCDVRERERDRDKKEREERREQRRERETRDRDRDRDRRRDDRPRDDRRSGRRSYEISGR